MKMINVSFLKEHPKNSEFFDDIEGNRWKEFLESIKTSGIIVPLIVTQDYIVVSGNQRLKAAKELGMKDVPCEIKEYQDGDSISKEDWILKDLIETNLRQRGIGNLNPMKTARCILELERIHGIKWGNNRFLGDRVATVADLPLKNSQSKLAEDIGISERRVRELKKLNNLIPELQKLVEEGRLSSSAGTQLAYLESGQQRELYEVLGEQIGNLKRSEIENIRKEAEKYKKQADDLARQLSSTEREKRQLEYMQRKLEEQLENIKPEVIEKEPADYQQMKQLLSDTTKKLEKLSRRLSDMENEKEKFEQEYAESLRQIKELQETNKKLKEQKEKAEHEMAELSRAEIQIKNKYQVRYKLSELIRDINGKVAEIDLLMKDVDNLQDKGINTWIENTINTFYKAIEKLESWHLAKDGKVIDVEYTTEID